MQTTTKKERVSLFLPVSLIERIDALVAAIDAGILNTSRNKVAAHVLETGLPLVEAKLKPDASTE